MKQKADPVDEYRNMRFSIIICTYNRAHSLRKVLESINKLLILPTEEVELIVVDNNSSDNTRRVTEEAIHSPVIQTKYIFEGKQGKSYALNTGIKAATGDVIAFTDDDVTVDSQWLVSMKDTFDRFDCIGIGGRIIPVWNLEKPAWFESEGPYKLMNVLVSYDLGPNYCVIEQKHVPPVGANYAFRREVFKTYGLFRTDLDRVGSSLLSAGDTEFVNRIIKHNGKVIYDPHATIYHPVEEHRLRKSYFQSWYFGYGRTLVRWNGIENGLVCYWGVPRYLLRLFSVQLFKWLFTFGEKTRFYQKLQLFKISGQIAEAYNLRKGQ